MDIRVRDADLALRDYFAKPPPSHVKLATITDIGCEGLMSVSECTMDVVVIRKRKLVLQSAVTFLEIKPGCKNRQHSGISIDTYWKRCETSKHLAIGFVTPAGYEAINGAA